MRILLYSLANTAQAHLGDSASSLDAGNDALGELEDRMRGEWVSDRTRSEATSPDSQRRCAHTCCRR